MKHPRHPGLLVGHDCLKPQGINVTEAAQWLGVSRKHQSDIVNCDRRVSPEMAIRVNRAVGGGLDTWYRLQCSWDLAQVKKHAHRIHVERIGSAV
ncbi:MAG: HigA family addiction module antitoxin [Gammaproteobacteria bacterium]|nr:HigA family addiction module antitoxin [Gammaproteobacteria bacterium]